MAEVGTAFVSILPSAKGFGPAMQRQIGPQMGAQGRLAGSTFGKAAAVGIGAAIAASAAIGKGLYEVGQTFNDARQAIIVGTGASGKALEGLEQSVKNIAKSTPSDIGSIGVAVSDLNTRLGLTGKPLEDMSSRMLNLSRITGSDLSGTIADTTRVFGDWGVTAKDQPKALDSIFEATKRTGIGLNKLTQMTVQFGAPLRQFGFGFEESLALFGKWEKEGVNTQVVLAGMKAGLGKFSKDGKDPVKALAATSEAIKNAGSAGEANQIAIEAFGQRAGPDMAAAVREGRFELGDLVKGIKNSDGAIADADTRTRTFAESWQVFKNTTLTQLAPAAEKVFAAFTDAAADVLPKVSVAFGKIGDALGPVKDTVTAFFADLGGSGAVSGFLDTVKGIAETVRANFVPVLEAVWETFSTKVLPVITAVVGYLAGKLYPIFKTVAGIVREQVIPIVASLAEWFYAKVVPAVLGVVTSVGQKLKPVLDAIFAAITNSVLPAVQKLLARFKEWLPTIQKVIGVVIAVVGWVLKFAAAILGKVLPPVIKFAGWLIGKLVGALSAVVGWVIQIIDWVVSFGIALVDAVKAGAKFYKGIWDNIGKVFDLLGDLPGMALDALGDLGSLLLDKGADLVTGLWAGIRSMGGWLKDQLISFVADHIPGPIAKALGISSPSKVMAEQAKWIPVGMAEGIESEADRVQGAVTKLAGGLHVPRVSPSVSVGGPGSGGSRIQLVVGDRVFDAYVRELADGSIADARAFAGTTRRMR